MPTFKVQAPDGSIIQIEGPADATDAELQQIAASNWKPKEPSTSKGEIAAEVGRTLDKGVRKGLTAFPGMIGDVSLAVTRDDTARSILPPQMRIPAELMMQVPGIRDAVKGTKWGDVGEKLETAGGLLPEVSKPQTKTGKATANIMEAIISTMTGGGPGTLGQKAVLGGAAGGGAEAGAAAFGDNPVVRLLSGLVTGGATGAVQSHVPNAQKLVKEATEHMTKADWDKAKALEKVLDAEQIPHLKSQLMGGRSTLDDTVVQASANPSARPTLTGKVEESPRAAHQALERWSMQNLPTAGPNNRSEVLTDVQEAAAAALKKIRDKSNTVFEAAMPSTKMEYSPDHIKAMRNELIALAKSPKFGESSDGGKAILKLADDLLDNSKGSWDTSKANQVFVKAFQRDGLDVSTLPGVVRREGFVTNGHKVNNLIKDLNQKINDPLNAEYKHLPALDVKDIMKRYTPEFDPARVAKRKVIETELNPAQQGLTGQIAKMGGGPQESKLTIRDSALATIFNPTQPQAQAIREMGKTMGGDQVGELLREHISKTMQSVLKAESDSPEKFVNALYRSPAQKENIEAALEVSARHYGQNPDAIKVGFRRMMESLDTFKDLKMASGVSPMATAQQAGGNWLSRILQPIMTTRRANDQFVTTGTYKQIANLVTSKDGLQKLEIMAKAKNPSVIQQILVSTLTTADQTPEFPSQ